MSTGASGHGHAQAHTAEEVRARNKALDSELRELAARITPEQLHRTPSNDEWTPAENLAHLAEFARYFAADIERQLQQQGVTVGRTHEHAERNAAVAAASGRTLDDLRYDLDDGLDTLATVLEGLRDEHLGRIAQNRAYGPEPLTTFLERYVLGHKAAHSRQLRETLAIAAVAHADDTGVGSV